MVLNKDGEEKSDQPWKKQGASTLDGGSLFSTLKKHFDKALNGDSSGGAFGLWGVIVLTLWFLSGIFIVSPAEQSVITRFGKYVSTLNPGVHWYARGIENEQRVNILQVYHFNYRDLMLTKDENIVSVELSVQYRTGDAKAYLFNVLSPIPSLQQATASALRQVIGDTSLDEVLTTGREAVRNQVQTSLKELMAMYKTGIIISDVALQPAKPPEEVTLAFDDAIKAREDEQRYINQAKAYAMKVEPVAEGRAARLIRTADAYRQKVVLEATAKTADFLAVLPEYQRSPEVTKDRLYLETMEEVLAKTSKIYVDVKGGGNNMLYIPLEKMLAQQRKNIEVTEGGLLAVESDGLQSAMSKAPIDMYTTRKGYDGHEAK